MSSTLLALKAQNEAKLAEERRLLERKRNIMVLMYKHCIDSGYIETSERMQTEAALSLSKYEPADNVDLMYIIQEFENFYELKFGKKPKLVRKADPDEPQAQRKSYVSATRALLGVITCNF
jgi:katanin p60 ATPase-containing subunit A1